MQVFCHDLTVHRDIFAANAVISQLAIQNGKALFSVDYDDEQACNYSSFCQEKLPNQIRYELIVQIGFEVKNEPKGSVGLVASLKQLRI